MEEGKNGVCSDSEYDSGRQKRSKGGNFDLSWILDEIVSGIGDAIAPRKSLRMKVKLYEK